MEILASTISSRTLLNYVISRRAYRYALVAQKKAEQQLRRVSAAVRVDARRKLRIARLTSVDAENLLERGSNGIIGSAQLSRSRSLRLKRMRLCSHLKPDCTGQSVTLVFEVLSLTISKRLSPARGFYRSRVWPCVSLYLPVERNRHTLVRSAYSSSPIHLESSSKTKIMTDKKAPATIAKNEPGSKLMEKYLREADDEEDDSGRYIVMFTRLIFAIVRTS